MTRSVLLHHRWVCPKCGIRQVHAMVIGWPDMVDSCPLMCCDCFCVWDPIIDKKGVHVKSVILTGE